jgi:hypothetical protein
VLFANRLCWLLLLAGVRPEDATIVKGLRVWLAGQTVA